MTNYLNGKLFLEDVSFESIAEKHGTPCYVYSQEHIIKEFNDYQAAFVNYPNTTICFSVKANSNLSVLNIFKNLGSGFDIVSGGELERVVKLGANPKRIVFSGVAKSEEEINKAIEYDILFFNVESFDELEQINRLASKAKKKAGISIRVNPDIDPKTHPYISTGLSTSKFGIPIKESLNVYLEASKMKDVEILGIDSHIGSQIIDLDPFEDSMERLVDLYSQLKEKNINILYIDIGGGLGIKYEDESTPPFKKNFAEKIISHIKKTGCNLILEPGRSLVGNSGYLLTKILYKKKNQKKNFLIFDAGMNDLLRPALYGSYHKIVPILDPAYSKEVEETFDIVGPICETGDVLGGNVTIPNPKLGDVLVINSAGAYGSVMGSNYNTRPKIPEILIHNDKDSVIRKRETISQILDNEVVVDL